MKNTQKPTGAAGREAPPLDALAATELPIEKYVAGTVPAPEVRIIDVVPIPPLIDIKPPTVPVPLKEKLPAQSTRNILALFDSLTPRIK